MKIDLLFFIIIPFVLMAAISVGFPFYRVHVLKDAGEKILPLTKKSTKLSYIASAIALILMFLSIMMDFGKLNFVIPYCAVLGLFIAIKESTFIPVNAVYEKLIINGSDIIRFSDITSVVEKDDSAYASLIKINTKHGQRQLIFNNSNEADEVRKLLNSKISTSSNTQ